MKNRYVETQKAVGKIVCHDQTKIERGVFKGPLFKRGHVIRQEDVEVLLAMGKHHVCLLDLDPGDVHEEEAGSRLAKAITGPGLTARGPSEGRFDLIADHRGLLNVDDAALFRINSIPRIVVATLHSRTPVEKGQKVAGAKVVPLVVKEKTVHRAETIAARSFPILSVLPYRTMRMAAVITGREVCEGRIPDAFGQVIREKAAFYGLEPPAVRYVVDDREKICAAILEELDKGCELLLVTGGMSVDPDDVTPSGIRKTGAKIIRYGAPVMPGAMFLMAYRNAVPIIGLPGCAMYADTTILDLLLPRILVGEPIRAHDIVRLGHGGLCRSARNASTPCALSEKAERSNIRQKPAR